MSAHEAPAFEVQWVNNLNRALPLIERLYYKQPEIEHPLCSALSCLKIELHEQRRQIAKDCTPWFDASAFDAIADPEKVAALGLDVRHPTGAMQCTVCKRVGAERAMCTDERCALLFA